MVLENLHHVVKWNAGSDYFLSLHLSKEDVFLRPGLRQK